MNHLRVLLRKPSQGDEGEETVRYVRLSPPLNSALSTFDYHNRRIKLFDVTIDRFAGSDPAREILEELESGDSFTKLTAYAIDEPGDAQEKWLENGFRKEGVIKRFYEDGGDATLWARYFDDERAEEAERDEHEKALEIARSKQNGSVAAPAGFRIKQATADDAEKIVELMQQTFEDYSVELSVEHFEKQIATHRTVFRLAFDGDGRLAAAASATLDVGRQTAEITDCVTRPDTRGKGLSTALVDALHGDLKDRYRVRSAYSLARAGEVGINCVLSRLGYEYTGRLVNNCRMPDGWESMNIWCRPLGA